MSACVYDSERLLIASDDGIDVIDIRSDCTIQRFHDKRSFLVDVLDTGGRACFTYQNGLFRPLFTPPEAPDLAFRANLSAFLQLVARQEDPDTRPCR